MVVMNRHRNVVNEWHMVVDFWDVVVNRDVVNGHRVVVTVMLLEVLVRYRRVVVVVVEWEYRLAGRYYSTDREDLKKTRTLKIYMF